MRRDATVHSNSTSVCPSRIESPAATGTSLTLPEAGAAIEVFIFIEVLVVDDEPTLRTTLAEALEQDGLRVVTAEDGREALEARRADPDKMRFVGLLLEDEAAAVVAADQHGRTAGAAGSTRRGG